MKSTVFKVALNVADMNRNYYGDHPLTIARHPSETDLRMIVRVLAFALNAHERLQFTKGLSDVDEPDLWQMGLTGEIEHWIELGQPQEKRIRQSCSKADRVSIYTYQKGGAPLWLADNRVQIERFDHLRVVHLKVQDEGAVTQLVDRSMRLSCVIQDDQALLTSDAGNVSVQLETAKDFRE